MRPPLLVNSYQIRFFHVSLKSKMKKFLVTGGAGFIGSHFVDYALALGHQVMAFDNLSTGQMFFLEGAQKSKNFSFIKGDICELSQIEKAVQNIKPDWVIHLAANADIRFGLDHPRKDLDVNTIGSWNVLEAMRKVDCKKILFSSTGSVYGEPTVFPTPEDCPFPVQTSLYAASKVSAEGLISAYAHGFGFTGLVYRFVSILGPRYTHGHVFDFVKQLRQDPSKLKVLGNGKQNKSYLHVNDLIKGLFTGIEKTSTGFQVVNIGHDGSLVVDDSIQTITKTLKVSPKIEHTGGERGWIGDSPRIQLDTTKLKKWGWSATVDLHQSVRETTEYLIQHSNLLDRE